MAALSYCDQQQLQIMHDAQAQSSNINMIYIAEHCGTSWANQTLWTCVACTELQ